MLDSTDDLPEGLVNLYYTDARAIAAVDGLSWKFAGDLPELNDATANKYFGTKTGNFDIHFYRNNVNIFDVVADGLKFSQGGRILSLSAFTLESAGYMNLISIATIATQSIALNSTSETKLDIMKSGATINFYNTKTSGKKVVAGLSSTDSLDVNAMAVSTNRIMEIRILLQDANGVMVSMKKELHVGADEVSSTLQDSYTSRNAAGVAAGVSISIAYAAGVVTTTYNSTTDLSGAVLSVMLEEYASF